MKLSNRPGAFLVLNLSLIPSVLASLSCTQLSGEDYTGPNGINFEIQCDTSTVNGAIFAYYSVGDEFQDCVDRCDSDSNCVAALFLRGSGDCALISTYQGTRSFTGNDLAIVRPATIPVTTLAESTSAKATTETTSSEATTSTSSTAEVSSTDSSTAEFSTAVSSSVETTSADTASTDTISTDAPSTDSSAAESSTVAPSLSDATSAESTLAESSTIDASTSQPSTTGPSSTELSSTQATTVETSSTSAESTLVTTTDSYYTSTATIETSTDDCEDETSTYEAPTTGIDSTSTGTGSDIQSTTLSAHSESSATTIPQSSELFTSPSSADSTTSSPSSSSTTGTEPAAPASVTSQEASSLPVSSTTAVAQTHTTDSQATSLSGSSSSETQKHGSMTLSTSDVTIMKTTTEGRLPTYLPASDCVWTVYLTMVKYVTCSTGVVPETSTTATYVTVDGNAGTHDPPVVQLPGGCIGGYQVDASGNSYPVVQPTVGSQVNPSGEKNHLSVRPTPASPGGSQPSYVNGQYHVPAPTAGSQGPPLPEQGAGKPSVQPKQGSQGTSSDSKSQPPVPGQDSPEFNGGEPHRTQGEAAPTAIPAHQSGTPAYPSLSSPIHQGQHNISMTFIIKTATAGGVQEHRVSSSSSAEAPSTPVIASGSNRHQSMLWTSIAGALLALNMLFV